VTTEHLIKKTASILFLIVFGLGCSQPTTFDRNNVHDFFSDSFHPKQPSVLSAEILGESEVKLMWKHENSDSVRFEIQRSKDNKPFEAVVVTLPGETEFNDLFQLDLHSSYKYRISSVKDSIRSRFTESESIIFELRPPGGLTISGADESFALLQWQSRNSFETNYSIQIRELPSTAFNVLTEDHLKKHFILDNLLPDREYEIRLAAVTNRYTSDYIDKEILFTERPREVRRIENSFSRDAAYLGNFDSRRIISGLGNTLWFVRNSPTQEHVIRSRYGNELTLIDNNQNHVLHFVINYDGNGSPPSIPPKVQVSSTYELIISHGPNSLQLYNFQGELVRQIEDLGSFTDLKISRDEQYIVAHNVKAAPEFRMRDRFLRVWTLPDLIEIEDYHIIRERAPGTPFMTDFEISSQNDLIAGISKEEFAVHLFTFNPLTGIEYLELIDFDIFTTINSLIFSDDDRYLFIEYYAPGEESNFMKIDLENSYHSEKFKIGDHGFAGKLRPFHGAPLFMAILSHEIIEYTYQHYWFFE
jgi:hypothetical protein